jgi:tetratricopeptide (TPR) repeat protein/curved DNA-binding protein CbpA
MNILSWLQSDSSPADYYELLGRKRFDPANQELLAVLRAANRQLLPYQNHGNPAVRSRAMALLRELGRAEDVFSDAGKLAAYHRELVRSLMEEYRSGPGQHGEMLGFRGWVLEVKGVHPDGLGALVAQLLTLPSAPALDTWDRAKASEDAGQPLRARKFRSSYPPDKANASRAAGVPQAGSDGLFEREPGDGLEGLAELRPIPEGDEQGNGTDLDMLVEVEPEPLSRRRLVVLLTLVALTGTAALLAWPWLWPALVDPSRTHPVPDFGDRTIQARGLPETWKLFQTAQRLQKAGDWEASIREYSRSLAAEEAFWPALAGRGECYMRRGRFREARKDLEAAEKLERGSARVCLRLGDACLETGDLAAARRHFESAIQIDRDVAEAHAGIGLVYYYEGRFDEAVHSGERGLRVDASCVRAYLVRAAANEEKGKYDQAIADCTRALQLQPLSLLALGIRREAHSNKADFDKAEADAQSALPLDAQSAVELNYRSECFSSVQDDDRALGDLDRALELVPDYVVALGNRASAHREKAISTFRLLTWKGQSASTVAWTGSTLNGPGLDKHKVILSKRSATSMRRFASVAQTSLVSSISSGKGAPRTTRKGNTIGRLLISMTPYDSNQAMPLPTSNGVLPCPGEGIPKGPTVISRGRSTFNQTTPGFTPVAAYPSGT